MFSLTDRASLLAAAHDPHHDPGLRALLRLRFEQLGGEGADFHVADADDELAVAEAAVGWPMTLDGSPCWEWIKRHPGGWTEVVFVLSDDGPAQVLLVPDGSRLSDFLREIEGQSAD